MAYKNDDEKLIGKNLRIYREEMKLTQAQVAEELGYERSVYCKWENGTKIPTKEQIDKIAAFYKRSADQLYKNVSAAIVHTSALLNNRRILGSLLKVYNRVIIPNTVMRELEAYKSGPKSDSKRRIAWQVMMKISQYQVESSDKLIIGDSEKYEGTAIDRIVALAEEQKKIQNGDVFIIHEDISISLRYKDSLLLKEFMASRENNTGYYTVLKLRDEWEYFDEIDVEGVNLNAYLTDGMTLLIDCIRCNTKDMKEKRNGVEIPLSKILQKIKFLLENNVDINQTDRWQHCLTPIAHSVQVGEIEIFNFLLENGADYNMGSRDTLNTSHFRMQNEGNTPLMIACYDGKKRFVDRIINLEDVSYNQQDANGYTALIKVAIGRNKKLKEGKPGLLKKYEEIYDELRTIDRVDRSIRDRMNLTASYYWDNRTNKEPKAEIEE